MMKGNQFEGGVPVDFQEFLSLQAEQEAVASAAMKEMRALQESIEASLKEAWTRHSEAVEVESAAAAALLKTVTLEAFFDPFFALSLWQAGWGKGMGSPLWSKQMQALLNASPGYFQGGEWAGDGPGDPLYHWTLHVPHHSNISEEEVAATVRSMEGLMTAGESLSPEYFFTLMDHNYSTQGPSYIFRNPEGLWQLTQHAHRDSFLHFEGTAEGLVHYLSKHHWHDWDYERSHPQPEDDNSW